MTVAGSLTYDTKLDTKGFQSGLNSISTKSVAIGNLIADAFKKVSTHLLDVGKKTINLASDLEEVQNVVDVTFGKDAEKINKWSKEANKAFGMSELSAKKFNGTMGAMLKSMGLTGDEVLEMSTEMTGLAGDFASFYNLDHEEAFNKIRAGISGETEPLKQLGINMSVANLEAFALSQGIDKTYDSMTQAEQATLRYNYLMSVSADAQGDFARTSDSFANQQRILQLNLENISATLGKRLLPYITEFVKKLNEKIQTINWEKLEEIFEKIWETITKLMPLIVAVVSAFMTFKTITGVIQLVTGAMTLLNTVMSMNPIMLIVMAITALVAAFIYLWNTSEGFREFWINLWDEIKNFFVSVWETIGKFFTETIPEWINSVIEWFKNLPYEIGYAIGQILGHIIQFGIDAWNWVTIELPKIIENIIQWFKELPGKIWNWLKQIPEKLKDMAVNLINTAKVEIPKFINTFVNFMKELPKKMLDIGKNIVQGIWNGIKNAKNWLLNKIKSFAKGITDGIKDFFGIKSPSRVMRDEVGQWLPKGIAVGIEANTDSALDSIDDMNDKIFDKMSNAVNFETGKMAFSGTSGSVSQILSANSQFTGNINNVMTLDGEVVYENQQTIKARKELQYGGAR